MSMKDWRDRHGLTQGAVEALFGVSRRSIVSWETGEKELPGYMRFAMLGYDAEQGAPIAEQPAAISDDRESVRALVEESLEGVRRDMRTLNQNQAALNEMIPESLEARLNALEARLPRGIPSIDELEARADRTLTNDDLAAAKARKLAELEALEADQAAVVPMNPYRPAPLTPAEEAARKARRAAAKAAHISSGEPWDE